MIQISQITFRDIFLKEIIFSDGEDLMKLLKNIGKDNIDIQDDELQTPRFQERHELQVLVIKKKNKTKSRPKILKVNSNYQIYHIIQKLNI